MDAIRLMSMQIRNYFGDQVELFESMESSVAYKLFEEKAIDILITDLDMMDVNGFHLLKKVKHREPLSQVVVITAHDSANAIRSAFAMGADDYFVKPVEAKALIDCLNHLVTRLQRWHATVDGLRRDMASPL
jgi:YesN/AraC family two-component response regulator